MINVFTLMTWQARGNASLFFPLKFLKLIWIVRQDQQQQQQPQQQEEEAAPPCQLQKTSNYINLQLYESCDEANIKEVRKATNVFVINPVDKSTFFETVTAAHGPPFSY